MPPKTLALASLFLPVGLAAVIGVGCGSQTPPAEAPAAAEPEPAETAVDVPEAPVEEPEASEASAPAEPAPEPGPPPPPPLSELCETMCGAQSSKCKPKQVEDCKRNYCDRYGQASDVCEPSVRTALSCATAQPDFLVCAHVIPDVCAKKFRAAEDCVKTGVAPKLETDKTQLPAGWAKYQAKDAQFTVAMPSDVSVKTEGEAKVWSAEADGARYEIRKEPKPAIQKFNQAGFLRVATQLLKPCVPKMKLFSLVELEDRSMIQFSTQCPDKTHQRGMLFVHGNDYFVVRSTWGGGENPDAETFAYSFARP